jgi:hypothetical protein
MARAADNGSPYEVHCSGVIASLRMQIRSAVVIPLVVHYAVCEDHPLVFIKGIELLPERSTEPGP